jgi:PAS domain S-box-containing protein
MRGGLKKKRSTSDESALSQLRADAEGTLAGSSYTGSHAYAEKKLEDLYQELQMHQIELEMQNEELRSANEELEIQQMKFAGFYDLAPIGYFILDKTGFIEEINNAAQSLVDSGPMGIRHRRFKSFIAPDYAEVYDEFYRRLLGSATKQSCQLKLTSTNNREFHAQIEGIAINNSFGIDLQYYIAVIDITERIEAEQVLAETKERLELSLNASSSGVWELNLADMQIYLDETNHRLCNVTESDFDSQYFSFIKLIHPADQSMADQHFRTAINNNKEIDLTCRFKSADNQVCYASIRGHQVKKPDHSKCIIGIMTDVTEKKHREIEAALLKQKHQQNITIATLYAEENERKRISEALHDSVSQLLYGIKIQLNQINTPHTPPEAYARINELLNIAIAETRNISFELAPSVLTDFGLPVTINELAKRLSSPQLLIKTKIKGFNQRLDLLLEMCVFRIIQELINNCMKHAGASLITVDLLQNSGIDVIVKDNGNGFNVKALEKAPLGTGISSIKNRLSLYNGSINIQSAPGLGTTVTIKLNNLHNEERLIEK